MFLRVLQNFENSFRLNLYRMVEGLSITDPSSFSNPLLCIVTDIHLNLSVNFPKKIFSGYVDLTVKRLDEKANQVILDTNNLSIHKVTEKDTLTNLTYSLSPHVKVFGSKMSIELPEFHSSNIFNIRIDYATSPEATGVQWLEPAQTSGKQHPYVYSHCEAIHARSVLPCQDTPYVKSPYSATISAPSELTVIMSALQDGDVVTLNDTNHKIFKFKQEVPIPAYLICFAVGALESRKIGPRSRIWSEKEMVDRAAFEFDDTEEMLKIAEDICGPYVWGIYDLLVLPPSFPLGGMENPCITFVTPTLVCGDKTLIEVIAHEICHSWTGNLVTNKNFEHFWLNEGFTVFLERKIIGRIHDEHRRHFDAIRGLKSLEQDVLFMGDKNPLTRLVNDLKGVDPEDIMSFIPYEKGHTFLFYLEELLGGAEVFDKYLRAYIEKFKLKSLDSEEWKAFLYQYFDDKKAILDTVDWDAWFFSPGMPPVIPNYDTTLSEPCIALFERWLKDDDDLQQFTKKDIDNMFPLQIAEFLSLLIKEAPLNKEKLEKMNHLYKISDMKNSDVRFMWGRLGLLSHWEPILPHALKFMTEQGRMKYIRPLYRDLYNWQEKRALALSTYAKHSHEMMYVAAHSVAGDLKLLKD